MMQPPVAIKPSISSASGNFVPNTTVGEMPLLIMSITLKFLLTWPLKVGIG